MSFSNCKLKQLKIPPQNLLEWLKSKTQTLAEQTLEKVEQEFSFMAGGNAKIGAPTSTYSPHMILQSHSLIFSQTSGKLTSAKNLLYRSFIGNCQNLEAIMTSFSLE